MLVVLDITDQKRAEALAELDRAKMAFFTNVNHELRTPLTLVLGPLQDALRQGELKGPTLEMVYRNALRLHRLVNMLLDLSRIEAGRMHVAYQATDLAAFTADLANSFRPAVEQAGLQLVIDTPPLPQDMAVYVDREMMEKVVVNLVSNAFNHTFEGAIHVSVHPTQDARHVELRVGDTGIGIPAEEQARVFDRFHQVRGARSRTQEGSGIGLSLVQELVRLQDGSVHVESEEGRGTTFTVRLPVGAAHAQADGVGRPGLPPTPGPPSASAVEEALSWVPAANGAHLSPVDTSPESGRVLVADDNADMRQYVADILNRNWSVQTAADGPAALAAVDEHRPDLVLLDVMMPVVDGFQVLATLRDNPETRGIPVIMLSARASEDAAVEALHAGANDYVVKPFGAVELSARVRTQIEAARARAQAEAAVTARDDFVGLVVHDLRHPLAAVNWHFQVLQRRLRRGEAPSATDFTQFVETTQGGLRALSTQIDELYDATRLQAGNTLDLHPRPTDLVKLAESVIQQYTDTSEQNRIWLESDVASLMGAWDAARLERVIANLLSNAIKYSPAGGDITMRVQREESRGVLSVEDHGIGIPAVDQPRIFERYRRGSNVADRIAGSGLGLSGVRGIVEQHGGTIALRSTEGEGSTFVVRLPLAEQGTA
jgi:signal transduction histidine kinase